MRVRRGPGRPVVRLACNSCADSPVRAARYTALVLLSSTSCAWRRHGLRYVMQQTSQDYVKFPAPAKSFDRRVAGREVGTPGTTQLCFLPACWAKRRLMLGREPVRRRAAGGAGVIHRGDGGRRVDTTVCERVRMKNHHTITQSIPHRSVDNLLVRVESFARTEGNPQLGEVFRRCSFFHSQWQRLWIEPGGKVVHTCG